MNHYFLLVCEGCNEPIESGEFFDLNFDWENPANSRPLSLKYLRTGRFFHVGCLRLGTLTITDGMVGPQISRPWVKFTGYISPAMDIQYEKTVGGQNEEFQTS
jgi:hypothetical protein